MTEDTKQKKINKKKLTLEQELFCKIYTTADSEFFGNGVQSYLEAFGPSYFAEKRKKRLLQKGENKIMIDHDQGYNPDHTIQDDDFQEDENEEVPYI